MISRPARCESRNAIEAELGQIQPIDKHVDRPHGIILRHSEGPSMTAQIKLALALASGFVVCCLGFGTLRAQIKAPAAYWVTETL
jgi:hypothetical protein